MIFSIILLFFPHRDSFGVVFRRRSTTSVTSTPTVLLRESIGIGANTVDLRSVLLWECQKNVSIGGDGMEPGCGMGLVERLMGVELRGGVMSSHQLSHRESIGIGVNIVDFKKCIAAGMSK